MNQEVFIGIGIFVAIALYLFSRKSGMSPAQEYEREIEKILTSDENKVKGKFE
ncbi:MAG: hypothetical protein V1702_03185 [Candidatus Woesearchaeota archaeon]